MAFSIQTNVNSLTAQENLRVNSNFQSMTIQRLTSGFRINSSGDDAAGLAIANKFRSDVSELSQGVRNANDGVSQLQIMDSGMNNIGKMLDRLKTLATQSSSDSFTGDRQVLNKEYQTLVNEIDRQAQSVGLSTGGRFAKSMSIFIGGGTTAAGAADTSNGSVSLDLANSRVDSKSLGLRTSEFVANSATGTNLASASNTSIANIVTANGSAGAATATFELSGPGFSSMNLSVSLTTSDTTATTADKLNAAIQAAGNAGTASANALREAGIAAKAITDSNGNEQLAFTSASSSFQVTAGTRTANALLGKFDASATNVATGASVAQTVTAGGAVSSAAPAAATGFAVKVTVDGTEHDLFIKLATTDDLASEKLTKVQAASGYAALANAGVTASINVTSGKLEFTGASNQSITVQATGDTANLLGLGAWTQGSEVIGGADVTTATAQTATMTVRVNGTDVNLSVTTIAGDATAAAVLGKLTSDGTYAALQAEGVTARLIGNKIAFEGNAGQTISVTALADAGNVLGFGVNLAGLTSTVNYGTIRPSAAMSAGANGDAATVAFSINGGDKILVSFTSDGTTAGAAGALQTAIDNNTQLRNAGLTVNTTTFAISAANSAVTFRASVQSQSGTLNLGIGTGTTYAASFSATGKAAMVAAAGSSQTGLGNNNDVFSFEGLTNKGGYGGTLGAGADQQVLSFSTTDPDGNVLSTSVTMNAANAYDVDMAVATINAGLQASSDPSLRDIVAVKETNATGSAEGIRFVSSLDNFAVSVGKSTNSTDAAPVGLYDGTTGATARQGMVVNSSASGSIDIGSQSGAKQAVVALGEAIRQLGVAQAAVGKGQNQLSYAIALAQAQITNFSAAQAQIRDADVAGEAANLTKAQVLQQASIAAMAQANSAPQAVLSLLRG